MERVRLRRARALKGNPVLSGVRLREMMCANPGPENGPKSLPPLRYVAGLIFVCLSKGGLKKYRFPVGVNSVVGPTWQPLRSCGLDSSETLVESPRAGWRREGTLLPPGERVTVALLHLLA